MKKRLVVLMFATALCLSACGDAKNEPVVETETIVEQASTSSEVAKKETDKVKTSDGEAALSTDVVTENNESLNTLVTDDIRITDANEALARLKEGNERFVNDESELINVSSERRTQLEEGQHPYAVVLSCSDSRVTPTAIFNAGLGEIFDIRVAGNVVDDDELGSIEYGVEHCHAPLLVIMGHENCGAVTAAYDIVQNGTEVTGKTELLLDKVLDNIEGATSLEEAIDMNTNAIYEQVMENEVVKELVESGSLKVVKAHYDLDGTVIFEE